MLKLQFIRTAVVLLIVSAISQGSIQAQQDPMFTQYFSNPVVMNPAYAGSRDALTVTSLSRKQWWGFNGSPVTQTVSAHSPVGGTKNNVGGSLIFDKLGITQQIGVNLAYARRWEISDRFRFSLGMHGLIRQRKMRWDLANPLEPIDNSIDYTQISRVYPNAGAGLYIDGPMFINGPKFLNGSVFSFGIGTPSIFQNELNYSQLQDSSVLTRLTRHLFVTGGWVFPINEKFHFKPMVLYKWVNNAPNQLDVSISFLAGERFWFGTNLRTGADADAFLQVRIFDSFWMGAAYDYPLTNLQQYQRGSFELMLRVDLNKRSYNGPFGIENPRYF